MTTTVFRSRVRDLAQVLLARFRLTPDQRHVLHMNRTPVAVLAPAPCWH